MTAPTRNERGGGVGGNATDGFDEGANVGSSVFTNAGPKRGHGDERTEPSDRRGIGGLGLGGPGGRGGRGGRGGNSGIGSVGSVGAKIAERFASPVTSALNAELEKLELTLARAWQILGVLIVLAGAAVAYFLDFGAFSSGLALGSFTFVWNTLQLFALKRGWRARSALTWTAVTIESVSPWLLLGGMCISVGPRVAFEHGLFGPCVLFGGVVMLTTLRMDPRMSVYGGIVSALAYVAVAYGLAPWLAHTQGADSADIHYSLVRSLVRAGFIVAGGCVGALIAHGLREAVGGTVSRVRAQDLFGKYRLEREIASGGMGTVWLARYCPEGGFERPAALKRIHAHLAKDSKFVDAFRREAQLGARLVHHNIVQVLDFGRVDEAAAGAGDDSRRTSSTTTYFLAMEFVDGVSCSDLIKRANAKGESIPPSVVALIGRGVLDGLAYAHEEARDVDGQPLRVVHRDLAPQNVLVSAAGLVKITDFGIARTLRDHTSAVTQAVGHAGHVAPEHADGKPIDARSDLFLVGVLLWELLCGRALFVRDNDMATLAALLMQPARKASSVSAAFAPWDSFLQRALEKDPAKRYASAAEMHAALDTLIDVVGVAPPEELGAIVRASGKGGLHDAATLVVGGGRVGQPSEERTATFEGAGT